MTKRCASCGHIKKEHSIVEGEGICLHTDENCKWDCRCRGWKEKIKSLRGSEDKQQIEDTHSSQKQVKQVKEEFKSSSGLKSPLDNANSRKGHYRGQFWREDTSKEKEK